MSDGIDSVNRATWGRSSVVSQFARRTGPVDAGEAAVLARLSQAVQGRPILDIGVGAGRTIPLLRGLSEDYVAVDYVETQVEAARRRFPGVRIEIGDARRLPFADSSFALAFFSFNGIDGLAHEDRPLVFAEAYRVVQPGGFFAYSTHNLAGVSHGATALRSAVARLRRRPGRIVRYLVRAPAALRSARRLRALTSSGDGWRLAVDPAYGFSVVWHHVSLAEAMREPRAAGFVDIEAYSTAGEPISRGDAPSTPWFHLVARKPLERGSYSSGSSPRSR